MKKYKILNIILASMLAISLIPSGFINTSALEEDGEYEEYIEETEDEAEEEHVHEFGDWYVDEDAGLRIRECACGARETEELENPTFIPEEDVIPEEDIIVEVSTNIEDEPVIPEKNLLESKVMSSPRLMSTPNLGSTPTVTQSKIILNTQFVNYNGSVMYTAYDENHNEIATKFVTASSNVTMKVPAGQYAMIVCELINDNLDNTTQSVTSVSGTFENAMYYLNVIVTYTPPCTHINTHEDVTDATYTSAGVKKTICNDCGKTLDIEAIPMLVCAHANTEDVIIRDSTEKSTGSAKVVCTDCNKTIRTKVIPKKEHVHTFEKETIASTCDTNGCELNVCTDCGYTEVIKTLPTTDHEWDEGTIVQQPTCSSVGWKEFKCKNCDTIKQSSIPALNHDFEVEITTPATCKDYGVKTYTCKNCGKVLTDSIPKTNTHDWNGNYEFSKTPTCTEDGELVLKCTICGEVLDTMETSKIAHSYVWVTKTEPTDTTDGLKEYKCKNCGNVSKTEVIPKTGNACTHPFPRRTVQKVVPTCTQREVVDVYCNQCGELIQENLMLYTNEENHPNLQQTVVKEPTYEAAGTLRYYCPDCGWEETDEIEPLTCNHPSTTIWENPTTGKRFVKCTVCKRLIKEYDDSLITNCSHTGYGTEEVVVTQADSTHWGEYNYVCKNCKKVMSTSRVHPYSSYTLNDENGNSVTLYGWFDDDYAHQVFNLTNEYRTSNGLNSLHYNTSTQDASNTRALEAAVYFSHTRPNGSKWNTVTSSWKYGGENLASGQDDPDWVMRSWKNSDGHNKNLLYGRESGQTPFKGLSVGCFHKFKFNNSYKPSVPTETVVWSQNFTFYEY